MNKRKSTRLSDYDYSSSGAYFITICTKDKMHVLGEVIGEEVSLSREGEIVKEIWEELPEHYLNIRLDEFIIMPNHVHGIIWILEKGHAQGAQHAEPLQSNYKGPFPGSLGAIVRSFKSAATKEINNIHNTPGARFWQRNYYEHIISDDNDLSNHRKYIQENPIKWASDEYFKE